MAVEILLQARVFDQQKEAKFARGLLPRSPYRDWWLQGRIGVTGQLWNYNTIEGFKKVDRAALLKEAAKRLLDSMRDGTAEADPSLLGSFLLTSFADLKTYKFYYWWANGLNRYSRHSLPKCLHNRLFLCCLVALCRFARQVAVMPLVSATMQEDKVSGLNERMWEQVSRSTQI